MILSPRDKPPKLNALPSIGFDYKRNPSSMPDINNKELWIHDACFENANVNEWYRRIWHEYTDELKIMNQMKSEKGRENFGVWH